MGRGGESDTCEILSYGPGENLCRWKCLFGAGKGVFLE